MTASVRSPTSQWDRDKAPQAALASVRVRPWDLIGSKARPDLSRDGVSLRVRKMILPQARVTGQIRMAHQVPAAENNPSLWETTKFHALSRDKVSPNHLEGGVFIRTRRLFYRLGSHTRT